MVRWLCDGSELNPSGQPAWTLRVPVVRPRLANDFLRGMAGGAGACAAGVLAAAWGEAPNLAAVWASATAAGLLALAGAPWFERCFRRFLAGGAVSALAISPSGAVALRVGGRWQEVELTRVTRGWRCLRLQARPACRYDAPGMTAAGAFGRLGLAYGGRSARRSFTVWQDALGGPAWRRTCVLTTRRVRRPARVAVAPAATLQKGTPRAGSRRSGVTRPREPLPANPSLGAMRPDPTPFNVMQLSATPSNDVQGGATPADLAWSNARPPRAKRP